MENKYQLPLGSKAGGLSFTTVVFFNLIISLLVSLVLQAIKASGVDIDGTQVQTYLSLLTSPVAIAIVLALTLRVVKQPAKSILPVKTRPKYYLIAVIIVFGALFSLNQLNEWVVELCELLGYQRRPSFVPDVSGWRILPVMLVVAIIPAFMEEIAFRGILLNNAERGVGTLRVIFVTGFCFAIYHGSVEQTVYQFIMGCIFGLLAVRSRSLGPVILTHFLNNAVILVLLACGAYDEATGVLLVSRGGEIALYVLSAVSLTGGLTWLILDTVFAFKRGAVQKNAEGGSGNGEVMPCQSGGVKTFFIWALIGIIIMAVLWIAGLFPTTPAA